MDNKIKLLCFPYAGGSGLVYNKWKQYLNKNIDLIPIEMSGRGRRFNEPLLECMEDVVNDLYMEVNEQLGNEEYALYGHSMGTVVIYELMDKIYKNGNKKPLHIFLSGRYPPHLAENSVIHSLPPEQFEKEIIRLGGTTPEVFHITELRNIFIPILKSDYMVVENYTFIDRNYRWDCDITILNGTEDKGLTGKEISEWNRYTNGKCNFYCFSGGHFFINQHMQEVVDIINENLSY